jgi:hypothetical protein
MTLSRTLGLCVVAALLLLPFAGCDKAKEKEKSAESPVKSGTDAKTGDKTPEVSTAAGELGYPGTDEGLKKFIADMLASVDAEPAKFDKLAASTLIPAHAEFFKKIWGERAAETMTERYAISIPGHVENQRRLFSATVAAKRLVVTVTPLAKPDAPGASATDRDAIKTAKAPLTLYKVALKKTADAMSSDATELNRYIFWQGGWRTTGYLSIPSE